MNGLIDRVSSLPFVGCVLGRPLSDPSYRGRASMPVRSLAYLSLTLAFYVGGCTDHHVRTTADSWYNPPPHGERLDEQQLVPSAEVKSSASDDGEQRLADSDVIPISAEEVGYYLDQPLGAGTAPPLYLVRGVYLNRGTGGFSVSFDGQDLIVYHGSLGRRAVPMKRQPLVVALPARPVNVYVTASMAE